MVELVYVSGSKPKRLLEIIGFTDDKEAALVRETDYVLSRNKQLERKLSQAHAFTEKLERLVFL